MPQTFTVGSRSRFVTFTGYLLIALAVLAVATAVAVLWMPGWSTAGQLHGEVLDSTSLPQWLQRGLPWLKVAGALLMLGTVAVAVGLMQRREWARRGAIALLCLAMLVNLAGLWAQQAFLLSMVDAVLRAAVLAPPVADLLGGLLVAARSMAALVTLGACGVLGWIAWQLQQPMVVQEFA